MLRGKAPSMDKYSPEEMRTMFLEHVRTMAAYWRTCNILDPRQNRVDGLAFSILVAIDGHAAGLPCAFDLVARPHPDDKQYAIANSERWVEDGTCLNEDVLLHELYYIKSDEPGT